MFVYACCCAYLQAALNAEIEAYKDSTVSCIGTLATDSKAAKNVWLQHGGYVGPWIEADNLGDESAYPARCSFSGSIVSPDQPESDDNSYDDEVSVGDDTSDVWVDDDDADVAAGRVRH